GGGVAAVRVRVGARLVDGQDAVAAHVKWYWRAGPAVAVDVRAGVPGLDLQAVRAAAVATLRVAVVARFARIDLRVAAHPDLHAGLPLRRARVPGLDLAEARAAVARDRVLVVARLAGIHHAVAAVVQRLVGLPRRRARPALLDLAVRVAPVAAKRVAVVALLAVVHRAVAAHRVHDQR